MLKETKCEWHIPRISCLTKNAGLLSVGNLLQPTEDYGLQKIRDVVLVHPFQVLKSRFKRQYDLKKRCRQ